MLNTIKELRKRGKISQSQMALELSVTQTTISKWESGERVPDANTICMIADYFNVSTDYLLNRVTAEDSTAQKLEKDELQILQLYRSLSIFNQKEALGFLRGLSLANFNSDSEKSI